MNTVKHNYSGILALFLIGTIIASIAFSILCMSCSRSITPSQAANGKAKCGKRLN